jgi:hypothetical protein
MFCFMQAWAAEPKWLPPGHLWTCPNCVALANRFEQVHSAANFRPLVYHLRKCPIRKFIDRVCRIFALLLE